MTAFQGIELLGFTMSRFLRSKIWHTFLQSKSTEYIQQFGLPKAAVEYNYTDDDFGENCIVTDSDFRFMEMLFEDCYVSSACT